MTKQEALDERKAQLLAHVPDVLDYKSVLYIGANTKRMQMMDLFCGAGYKIDILEVWPHNIRDMKLWNIKKKRVNRIILSDVRIFKTAEKWDVVFWWHGPEHVTKEELPLVLMKLEAMAGKLIVLASPWGRVSQGKKQGNPFERHVGAVYPITLDLLGYSHDGKGTPDKGGSNLLAWKRVGA